MNKLNFGTVNKIFLDFEFPFLSPEISEIILLWDRIDEKALPISERWFRKIYSFSKVSETLLVSQEVSIRVFLSHFVRFRTMEYVRTLRAVVFKFNKICALTIFLFA